MARSLGRHDTLTQMTAKHETSRWSDLRSGSSPEGVVCPKRGRHNTPISATMTETAEVREEESTVEIARRPRSRTDFEKQRIELRRTECNSITRPNCQVINASQLICFRLAHAESRM